MKKRIITSALALALAFSLCACTDNTSTTESYSDSTSGTVVSSETASFAQSGDSVLYLRVDMKQVNRIRLTKP